LEALPENTQVIRRLRPKDRNLKWAHDVINETSEMHKFHGEIIIKFESGKIAYVRRTETMLPPEK